MRTQSSDTSVEAEKVLIELLRKAGTTKRLSIAFSLSDTVRSLAKNAIQDANPFLNEREINLLFVKYHYGDELARKVLKYLSENKL